MPAAPHPLTDSPQAPRSNLAASRRWWLLLTLTLTVGCSTPAPQPNYQQLADQIQAGSDVSISSLRAAFLQADTFNSRMQLLAPLEQQAMELYDDEPLRLGAVGAAIIDQYLGSITGHAALSRYYRHLGAEDAAAEHDAWIARIRATVEANADGSMRAPYPVISATEAQAYLRLRGLLPVGSMYYSTEQAPFMALIAAKPQEGRLQSIYFDLTGAYQAISSAVIQGHGEGPFTPGQLIDYLAQQDDDAALTSIGSYLYYQQRLQEAEQWFRAASAQGNAIAGLMLGHIYQVQAQRREGEARAAALELALDQYTAAIALSSDEAMFSLGTLYLDGFYGEENVASGLALLQQAAQLGSPDAMLWLGHLYQQGVHLEANIDSARHYFAQAAEAQHPGAQKYYVRFLLSNNDQIAFDRRTLDWLDTLIATEDAEAMLLRGALHARGLGVPQNFRQARRWYRRAAEQAPHNADLINEIAWTLTVSHLQRLRQPAYALQIMDRMMNADPMARHNPAYLDTWAAAYAANGNFRRALELQERAVQAARDQRDDNMLSILERHLALMRQGRTISDQIP